MDDPHLLRVTLLTYGNPDTPSGGHLFHRRVADRAAAHRARLSFVALAERPFPLAALRVRAALRQAGRQSPHVLLVDSVATAFVGPWLHRPGPRGPIPVAGMLHQPPGGIDHRGPRRWTQALLDRYAYRRAVGLLVASADLRDQLRAAGVPADRLTVVAPGRDPVSNPPAATLPDLRGGRRIALLHVGHWQRRKGLLDLLTALARLPEDTATLHVAGDPDTEPSYRARVRRALASPALTGRVVVHGLLPAEQLDVLYRAADAFALPSRREPYGTAYGEAMARGLPVVGWRAGNLPHLARHEREGLIVATGSIGDLAAAVHRLAHDPRLRHRLAAAARARAAQLPTWDDTAHALFTELRRIARGPLARHGARGNVTLSALSHFSR